MSRRVDDVDGMAIPFARYGGGLDGDAPLALLHHEIRGGVAVMHITMLVYLAGVEQDALCGRGLAGVDMGHDADVAYVG